METVDINVSLRDAIGKEKVKKVRKSGVVPAIVYGKGENIAISLDRDNLRILRKLNFSDSAIVGFNIEGVKDKISAIIKDVQYDPVTDVVIHIDFMRVSMTEKIHVHVPVILLGESKGAKAGGDVEQILREVEIESLPTNIPEKFELDITNLEAGHSLHVSDLSVPAEVKLLNNPGDTVVAVVVHKKEEAPVSEETQEAGAEPVVIKKEAEKNIDSAKE